MPRPHRPWFRFYVEAVHDRKLRRVAPATRWLWVCVLAVARDSEFPGKCLIGASLPSLDDWADVAALKPREVKAGLDYFAEQGMTVIDDVLGCVVVTNWDKRQFEGDFSRLTVPKATAEALVLRDEGVCQDCGAAEGLEIDHIVPVTKGGSNELSNLQLLCGPCNRRKGNRVRQQRYRTRHRNAGITAESRDATDNALSETEPENLISLPEHSRLLGAGS